MNAQHPRQFGYFTPPPLPMSIDGRAARADDQPGRRRVARRADRARSSRRRSCAGCATSSATARTAFGLLTSGGVMANFMAHGAGPRHPPRPNVCGLDRPPRGATSRASASTPRPDPLLDRAGARRAGLPARDAGRGRRRRAVPAPRRAGRGGDRPRPGRGPDAVRDRGRGRLHEHRLGRRARRAGRRGRARGPVAPRRRGVRRRRPGCPRAMASRVPDLDRADSVTVDPHKWFFQAYDIGGLLVRDGGDLGQVVRRPAPEYYRGGEGPDAGQRTDDHDERRRASSTSTSSASRAPAAGGRSSCGCRGSTSAPKGFGRLIEANDDLAAHLAGRCAEADDFEALPDDAGAVASCASATCPAVGRGAADGARRARRPPGPAPGRARGVRRRLAHDDAPARARPSCAPGSSTTSRPRPTSTACSTPCGASRVEAPSPG